MTPASPVAHRLPVLGCVLLGAAALALSACGGGGDGSGGASTAAKPAAKAPERRARQAGTGGGGCRDEVGGFIKAMTRLRSNLAVGLSYEQYAAEMHGVRAAYGKVPVQQLTIDCLYATGAPGEKALNQYVDAANAWGECLAETGCTTASIERALQHRWRVASHYLSEALQRPPA